MEEMEAAYDEEKDSEDEKRIQEFRDKSPDE